MMNIEFMKFPDDGVSVWVIREYDRFGDIPLNQSGYHLMIKTLIDEYNEEYRGECQLEGRYFVKIYPVCEAKTPAFMPGMKRA